MAESIIEYINLVFKVLRYTLITLNTIVIIFALYFIISGNGLGGEALKMHKVVRIILCLLIIAVAIVGIVGAIWWGKTKIHVSIILGYVISALILMVIGIILSAIYVRNMSGADVTFTVFTVIISFLIVNSSLGFAYSIKKTRVLRRLNVVTA